VVPAKDSDAVTIPELEGYQKGDCLNRIVSTIDVVAHEKVVRVWGVPADAEEF
jgi:hypothetical protein